MPASSTTAHFDRTLFAKLADWLAVAVAVALPWSTTATGVAIALWLIALLPALDWTALKRELVTFAGGLPVLLWGLGAVGMLWADVSWSERLGGLDGFDRLLVLPLLLAQFRRSEHGDRVICGFLVSASIVLIASFIMILVPNPLWRDHVTGVPVHDDIFQGSSFLICGFGAVGYALLEGGKIDRREATIIFIVGALFLVNFAFVTISRATVLVVPVLTILFGWQIYRWKGVVGTVVLMAAIGAGALLVSPSLRHRTNQSIEEYKVYRTTNAGTSIGEHLAFLEESFAIVASAPVVGHGTGSITEQFRRITAGKTGVSAEATVNPHNQTFGVAIQLGVIGALVLWAMWIAHFLLFRGAGAAAWLGTVVVTENVISSAVHSHLFDFNNGWLYVFGVGVLGGMMLRKPAASAASVSTAAS